MSDLRIAKGLEFFDFVLQENILVDQGSSVLLRVSAIRKNGKIMRWSDDEQATLKVEGESDVLATEVNGTYFEFTLPTSKDAGTYTLTVESPNSSVILNTKLKVNS